MALDAATSVTGKICSKTNDYQLSALTPLRWRQARFIHGFHRLQESLPAAYAQQEAHAHHLCKSVDESSFSSVKLKGFLSR
jgi:hypothetical protein